MGRAFEYRRAAKEKRWGMMSRVFPKLGKAITVAAKAGVPDPEMNAALRTAIQNAKAQNMPKANIDAAIKRAAGKDTEAFMEELYEGKGPYGVMILVECLTDNHARTVANMKWIFNKWGAGLAPSGSMLNMFSRKAVIQFEMPAGKDREELEMELIDAGLEELSENEGTCFAYADYTDFGSLTKAFEDLKIETTKATLQYIPVAPVELSEEQMEEIEKLIDKIEEDDDVQQVFTNIA
ncbi:MAG TPA: YebC/PmpR family DNA-binding transcriptional regulator [Prolixibacteraceae bacterium]|jgi:YebC/PmpR family DNA-binding regulatory protein|nr:YebC/PmpR family DNA-binding transcriptional regulator [Prolixibacteraceae bacterium]HPB04999.1 YebC/PmpR family DNA-binding transcriptional regulator [Prolixibacteraceae bacterium]HQN94095.1 YebC/PmpR family DNA-binding transcriptional regulator [Prolixibacteraceae bacterium]HUM89572.1 YebC/PmpR family DNA-binding transcriptional regulator [Prolixibacteraceae bacterium]